MMTLNVHGDASKGTLVGSIQNNNQFLHLVLEGDEENSGMQPSAHEPETRSPRDAGEVTLLLMLMNVPE